MAGNGSLRAAKAARDDEFYTRYCDVEEQMEAYVGFDPDVFRDKAVLLPCDDPERSAFVRYFAGSFARLGLRRLCASSWAGGEPFVREGARGASRSCGRGRLLVLGRGRGGAPSVEFSGLLEGDGDFRSDEVTDLRDACDMVATNPPFSLFREFLPWAAGEGRLFAVVGSKNAATAKAVFPLFKDGSVRFGPPFSGAARFHVPPSRARGCANASGLVSFGNVGWYSNVPCAPRRSLRLDTAAGNLASDARLREKLARDYGALEYPRYDNFDAIEVPFVRCIPSDCDGPMGVPLTFLDYYDPAEFELLGTSGELAGPVPADASSHGGRRFYIGGRRLYDRVVIRRRRAS